jgi:hypothetical protein
VSRREDAVKTARLPIFPFLLLTSALAPFTIAAQSTHRNIVDYCSVVQAPDSYVGKSIQTTALMHYSNIKRVDGDDTFLYGAKCNNGDFFTVTSYGGKKPSNKVYQFFQNLPREKEFVLEVTLSGKFNNSRTPMFGHLSWALSELNKVHIISIEDVTANSAYPKPGHQTRSFITGEDSVLLSLNTDLLLYLSGEEKKDASKYISEDFILLDTSALHHYLGDLEQFRKRGLIDKGLVVNEKSVINWSYLLKYADGNYFTYGIYLWTLESGKEIRIGFESVYRRSGDSFVLKKVTLRSFK